MEQQLIVSCLGRPMELGMLYDCRSDEALPGVTLWSHDKLQNKRHRAFRPSNNFEITADDSIEKKAHMMDIEANLKMSFLSGMVQVEGAAKYLNSQRKSSQHSRVILKYSCKTWFEQLTMDQLASVDFPTVFDNGMATHVVTGVVYGADAFFTFEREVSDFENKQQIEGQLQGSIDYHVSKASGEAKADINEEENKLSDKLSCKVLTDISLEENPSSFKDAMAAYRDLPRMIRGGKKDGEIYGVPKKVYLYPLCKLDSTAAKLVRMISANVVFEVQYLMEAYQTICMEATDLESSKPSCHFRVLKEQFRKFRSLVQLFQSEFQQVLAEILPKIRGGGAEEAVLSKKLKRIKRSPYNIESLQTWLDARKREISILSTYMKTLESSGAVKLALKPGELDQYTQDHSVERVLCLDLGAVNTMDGCYIATMSEFTMDAPDDEKHAIAISTEAKSWCDDEEFMDRLRHQIRIFCDCAIGNKDVKTTKSVVIATADKKSKGEKPGVIWLYVKGRKQDFQFCSPPTELKVNGIGYRSVELSWEHPDDGADFVLEYKIECKEISDEGTDGAAEEYSMVLSVSGGKNEATVETLKAGRTYAFVVTAISKWWQQRSKPSPPVITMSTPFARDLQRLHENGKGVPSSVEMALLSLMEVFALDAPSAIEINYLIKFITEFIFDRVKEGTKVLTTGMGGVMSPFIAAIVGPSGKVTILECTEVTSSIKVELKRICGRHSYLLDSDRVEFVVGDKDKGCPKDAPYDFIIGEMESGDKFPPALFDQLAPRGNVVVLASDNSVSFSCKSSDGTRMENWTVQKRGVQEQK